jgi:UDP-3-O-[3-hydroxymyristoyl] glucosamine N-acyltransferase
MTLSLKKIAELIGATLIGDSDVEINGISTLTDANGNQISYAVSEKYINSLSKTKARAVILPKKLKKHCPTNALIVDDVYLAFAKMTHQFKHHNFQANNSSSKAIIDSSASVEDVTIGSGCVIGKNVSIDKNTIISPNCVIEDEVSIGENSYIGANVTIQRECQLGKRCTILPGAVIGSEGFGNALDEQKIWQSIAHLGRVCIGDDVSIGANTTIDRGTIDDTVIHNGVKIDNLVQIAHNVIIGENTAIAAKTGIAGTTTIGKRCMIGGMVGIVGHLTITDDVIVNATSTVNRSITKPGIYTGFFPLMTHSDWKKVGMWLTKLDKITKFLNIKLKNLK